MARPRVVAEERRPIQDREPLAPARVRPHEWLTPESKAAYGSRSESGLPFDVYLSSTADDKMRRQATKDAQFSLEVMGFLLGEVGRWRGKVYSVVRDVVTTQLKSSASKVRFDPDAFPKLFKELDASGFDYILVGWYHSHPGHTCFLSKTDLRTQRTMFDQPYHTALVLDPVNQEMKTFRLDGDGYVETAFAVFEEHPPEPSAPKLARSRKLKIRPLQD